MFDISLFGALTAGLLSFLSPCILPIVPFYLSYLAGVSAKELASERPASRHVRHRVVLASILFSLGIITIFVGLGASATAFGQAVRAYFDILRWIAAAIIIVMGLHFLGVLRLGILYRQFRLEPSGSTSETQKTAVSLMGAYGLGLAFAFGWTPCVGPVLAAILFTAAAQGSSAQGAGLLFVYGLGMTLPFIFAALFIGPFMRWMSRFQRHLGHVERLMGLLLLIFGALIATNSMALIAEWMLQVAPWFVEIG